MYHLVLRSVPILKSPTLNWPVLIWLSYPFTPCPSWTSVHTHSFEEDLYSSFSTCLTRQRKVNDNALFCRSFYYFLFPYLFFPTFLSKISIFLETIIWISIVLITIIWISVALISIVWLSIIYTLIIWLSISWISATLSSSY